MKYFKKCVLYIIKVYLIIAMTENKINENITEVKVVMLARIMVIPNKQQQ